MRSSTSALSPPHSPPPAPLPLASSSSVTGCPELDLSVNVTPTPKTEPSKQNRPLDGHTKGQKVSFKEPLVCTLTLEPHGTFVKKAQRQQPIRADASKHIVEFPVAESNPGAGCLETVGLNSTLALKAELQSLQSEGFNSQKAVQETLRKSERTKNLINTKATDVVNVSRSQLLFNSLVSVSVQKDELIHQLLQDRLTVHPLCHEVKAADGPSLSVFVTSDLVRQKPLPPSEEPPCDKLKPLTRRACSTFDLSQRQRRWEATP
ncbi:protein phosphatase 1 regulatory subunit 35 [Cynoglossus semilaevis]|uniref:Protein phosphatase 1 regulatory subunit 35 n=1 Tax=Cynoglossus semilaevis TaxID=244447 RepID=A0A3P8VUE7_CYNSE|nr:protein phosphatase 1 regulatory subunit 35 [Cynoglossus semilaevis]